jgi:hypothetical protein
MSNAPPARRASLPTILTGAACLLAVAGCTTSPTEYAFSLSQQDPKWQSPECAQMRAEAATYGAGKRQPLSWGAGALLGPYGLALAAASKDHQEKQRQKFVRDMHLTCSSRPLPKELEVDPTIQADDRRDRP